jgi:hypothetical protein
LCGRLEKRCLSGTQRCEILGQSYQIDIAVTRHCDLVFCASSLERSDGKAAHLDRMIDQRVIVSGPITPETISFRTVLGQGGGHPPVAPDRRRWRQQIDRAGACLLADDSQANA